MRKFLTLCSVLVASATTFASPVRSVLGADGTEATASDLPFDSEVEYLQGDGSSAILTDISWRLRDVYTEIDFAMPEVRDTANKVILGSDSVTLNYVMARHRSRDYFAFNDNTTPNLSLYPGYFYTGAVWFEDNLYRFNLNGDDATYSSSASFGAPRPLYLFVGQYREDYTGHCFKGAIYAVRIYADKTKSVLIAHLVPVRIAEEGFLYDRVGGGVYGNIGTGSFILGADL